MRRWIVSGVLVTLACCVFLGMAGVSLAATLAAGDLRLSLDDAVRVTGISVGSFSLPVEPAPLVMLYDVEQKKWFAPKAAGSDPGAGVTLEFSEAKATATVTIRSSNGALRFACRLKGADLPARGLLLRVAFPVDATGWHWHQDMQTAVPIDKAKVYENVAPLRAWADLPEWKDQPDLRMGYSSTNFCAVVTGPVGLCLAVPADPPRIFRTAYHGAGKRLEIVYDFALSPDTKVPNQAEFAFDLYACDPRWGFRGALETYYRLYPDMFRNYVEQQGQWMPFTRLSEVDNANEFYFGLQEGSSEPDYDNRLGVLSTSYFAHAGMGANIPNYDPEKDPLPPHEVQVQAMEAAFKRATGIDGIYGQVGLYNSREKLDVRKWVAYAHLIAQFNLDPELPYGRWILDRAIRALDDVRKRRNARLDGFYYDGLSTGISYRRDHFKTADSTCLWDPVAKKPLLNNFFCSCEFARSAAEMLRPLRRITMMNGALGASFYVAPWLDVLGAETGLSISRERLNYIRTVTYHKPFLTLLKGNYHQQLGHAQIEAYMKQCVAYGVFPGFFDWPTSGLGPGGSYWAHPAYYERDRNLHRRYQPLCRALAMAGWEPVTWARSDRPQVYVERFGPTADGLVWLTVFNAGKKAERTTLSIQPKPLKLDAAAAQARGMVTDRPLPLSAKGDELASQFEIPAGDLMVIQLGSPAAQARWRIAQALETLDRGMLLRDIDKDKPPMAVHWRTQGRTYAREEVGAKPCLVLRAGAGQSGAHQWAMLFQTKPEDLVLRVRAAGQDLAGGKGAAGIECRLAWVTPSFTYYETRQFELPLGTYDWKDFEFAIQAPKALRSIHVTPRVRATKGTLRLAKVSLANASGNEYVVDPEFAEWYDPLPTALREPVATACRDVRADLVDLQSAATKGPAEKLRPSVAGILGRCRDLTQLINRKGAANGCRRVLRDLETIEQRLSAVGGT